ncbi:hypothetical protein ACFRFL_05565 [Streptomyces sp. NPDC056708]|uniref:hypothetical protein n=1 Tax=unclassified Streptomyces TaxID=2593676 RepID=UPI0036C4B57D
MTAQKPSWTTHPRKGPAMAASAPHQAVDPEAVVIAVACMKETAQKPLAGSPPSVGAHEEAAEPAAAQTPDPRF